MCVSSTNPTTSWVYLDISFPSTSRSSVLSDRNCSTQATGCLQKSFTRQTCEEKFCRKSAENSFLLSEMGEIVLKKKMKTSQGILRFAWASSTESLNLLRILTHSMRNCSSQIQQTTASSSPCVRGGEKGCLSRKRSTKARELKFYFDYFSIQFQIVEAWQAT